MEGRKSQLQSSLEQLKLEYAVIIKNLGRIVESQANTIDSIANTNNDDLLNNSNWLLDASSKQFIALQKFVEMSMDVEKFVALFIENPNPALIETSNLLRSYDNVTFKKEISTAPPSTKSNSIRDLSDEIQESGNEEWEINLIEEPLKINPNTSKSEIQILELPKTKKSETDKIVINNNKTPSTGKKGKKKRYRNRLSPSNNILIRESSLPIVNDMCYLCYCINPQEIYINLTKSVKQLDEITKEIKKVYSKGLNKFKTKEDFQRAVDKYSVYFCEKYKTWHRVEILDWMMQTNTSNVKIKLIDYGEYREVSYKDMQMLPESLYRIPKLALQCDLAFLYPPTSTTEKKINEWPQSSIDALNNYIYDNNIEYQIVYLVENSNNTISVDLKNVDSEEATLGDILINQGFAVELSPYDVGLKKIEENIERDQILDNYFDNMNFKEEAATLGDIVEGYDAQDEARICKFRTKCRKKYCNLEHEDLRMDGCTTDRQATYSSSFCLPEISVGNRIEIVITHVDNVNRFYAQLRCDSTLKQLLIAMNRPAIVASYKPLKLLPASGEIILAKNWDDKWNRAMVKDVDSVPGSQDVSIHVFFVDFGNEMMVPIKDCRLMKDEYMHTTFKAIQCYLHNIKIVTGKTLDDAKEYFESKYLSAPLIAEVKYRGANSFDLSVFDNDNTDISTIIVEDGFGEYYKSVRPNMNIDQLLVD